MIDIKKKLGIKICSLRKEHGYSQMQFAELIGISTNALGLIETGKGFFTDKTLEKILTHLNIEPKELFSFDFLKSDEELFNDIIRKLNIIKNNREKLEIIDIMLSKVI